MNGVASVIQILSAPSMPANAVKQSKYMTQFHAEVERAKERASSGDWDDARPGTLLALCCLMHQLVYGVLPSELLHPATFERGKKIVSKMQRESFANEPAEVALFIRWAWQREKRLYAWAQSKSVDRKPLNWNRQFSRELETEYRIERKAKRA